MAALQHFQDTFSPFGLGADVLVPCYGMAETVLATTLALRTHPAGPSAFGRVTWKDFDRQALEEKGIAAPALPGRPLRRIISCGQTIDGLTIKLATAETKPHQARSVPYKCAAAH